jgi:ribonuclease HII
MPRSPNPSEIRCTSELEILAMTQGYRVVAGCDEAGRGALIGPLYAAAVILDPAISIPGIDDSKKLTAQRRELLAVEIRAKAVAWHVVSVTAEEVDAINVYEASRQGMLRALKALIPLPDFILTDAMPLRENGVDFSIPHRAIIHGDALSISIAAASIVAKVERDPRSPECARPFRPLRRAPQNLPTRKGLPAAALHTGGAGVTAARHTRSRP